MPVAVPVTRVNLLTALQLRGLVVRVIFSHSHESPARAWSSQAQSLMKQVVRPFVLKSNQTARAQMAPKTLLRDNLIENQPLVRDFIYL